MREREREMRSREWMNEWMYKEDGGGVGFASGWEGEEGEENDINSHF